MNDHDPMTRLLGTAGEDAGCEGGMAVLAAYVEAVVAGPNADDLFPGLATHLHNCPACAEDYEGVVALVREQRP